MSAPDFISDEEFTKLKTKSASPDFISDDEFTKIKSKERGIQAESALQGFGQAGTLGYLNELSALAGKLVPDPNAELNKKLTQQGFTIKEAPEDVSSEVKRLKQREKGLIEQAPGSFAAGNIAGSLATAPATAGIIGAAGKGLLGAERFAAMGPATKGALSAGVEAYASKPQEGQTRLEQATKGAIFGGVAAKASDIISKAPKALETFGANRAAKALGLSKAEAKKLIKTDPMGLEGRSIQEIGKFASKNGLIQPGDDIASIAQKSGLLKEEIGSKIGDTYNKVVSKLDDVTKAKIANTELNPTMLAVEFSEKMDKITGSGAGQAKAKIAKELEDFIQLPDTANVLDLQKYKSSLDDTIFAADKNIAEIPQSKKVLKQFRDFLRDKIEARIEALDKVSGGKDLEQLKKLNKDYGLASTSLKISRDKLSSEVGNRMFSPYDVYGAGAGAMIGAATSDDENRLRNAALGAGVGLLSKGYRSYGRPQLAKGLMSAAELSKPIGEAAKKVSPELSGIAASRLGRGLLK